MDNEIAENLRERINERYQGQERENHLNHIRRFIASLGWLPDVGGRVLELGGGAGLFMDLVRQYRRFELEFNNVDFNFEKDVAPFPSEVYDGVLLMEVLEHFRSDPMFALSEINRILKPGGFLFLTTPNIASWRSIQQVVHHDSPYIFGVYPRSGIPRERHNREYSVKEVGAVVIAAGFGIERLEALNVYEASEDYEPLFGIAPENRGDTTFCLCRKEGLVRDRYPSWLYY